MLRRVCIAATVALGCSTGSGSDVDETGDDDSSDDGDPRSGREVCDNGDDDDRDGRVDDDCDCRLGVTQRCYPGDPGERDVGACSSGTQRCVDTADGLRWTECEAAGAPGDELCDHIDNDCNGAIDDLATGIACELSIELPGFDCVAVTCPAEQPHPVACVGLTFLGSDDDGCVAYAGGATVFFKEGDSCSAGGAVGSVVCSQVPLPGGALAPADCPHNKPDRHYVTSPGACPD